MRIFYEEYLREGLVINWVMESVLQGEGSAASKAGVGRLANLGVTLQRR